MAIITLQQQEDWATEYLAIQSRTKENEFIQKLKTQISGAYFELGPLPKNGFKKVANRFKCSTSFPTGTEGKTAPLFDLIVIDKRVESFLNNMATNQDTFHAYARLMALEKSQVGSSWENNRLLIKAVVIAPALTQEASRADLADWDGKPAS